MPLQYAGGKLSRKCFRYEEGMLRGGYENVMGKRPRCPLELMSNSNSLYSGLNGLGVSPNPVRNIKKA